MSFYYEKPMRKLNLLLTVFFITLSSFSLTAQENVSSLLESAKTKAQKENKAILVKFEASWCSWCKKMTKDMKAETTKEFFEQNFVMVPIIVQEYGKKKELNNPGGEKLMRKFKGRRAGLPFWAILDSNGKMITNSYANGQNLGGPSTLEEVRLFIRKLRKAVPKISKEEKEAILKQFVRRK